MRAHYYNHSGTNAVGTKHVSVPSKGGAFPDASLQLTVHWHTLTLVGGGTSVGKGNICIPVVSQAGNSAVYRPSVLNSGSLRDIHLWLCCGAMPAHNI